ncbi:hypothetical protein B8A33_08875, partial [Dolosigranulum pigrum]|uniref:GA module-containing protein n=1 Tax=Dolosigranulum pigrum TaxID=29394 RepID=UPI000DC054DD
SANNGVDYYKEQAQPKVTNLPDSVEDIKKELQERLDKVQKATLPSDGGDTTPDQDGAGSSDTGSDEGTNPPTNGAGEGDAGSGQGTGDQTPGQGGGDSTEDSSTEGGSSESSDDQSDEPDENSELKDKQKAATEALDELSHLDEKQKEDYQKNIAEAQDEGTVEYIVDKAQLENIKKLNTASKKDKDADERKEVTVEDQEEAKRNIEEIKGRLNDPNNNLTQEQKKELKKLLGEIEVPRTHHYLPQIGNAVQEFLSTGMLTNKAAHARVGWQANGQDNGNGIVWNKEVNFSSGDDILEVREGVGQNARINLGAGNDEFIIHGTMPGVAYAFRRTGELTYVDGGTGKDKAIMKSKSKQILQIQYIRNFNEVVMDGTDGELQITKENLEKSLGKEKVLKVRKGANGKNNTVKLYGMAPEGRGDIVRDKETGINYRKWKYKGLDKEIWIEATRDLKTEF